MQEAALLRRPRHEEAQVLLPAQVDRPHRRPQQKVRPCHSPGPLSPPAEPNGSFLFSARSFVALRLWPPPASKNSNRCLFSPGGESTPAAPTRTRTQTHHSDPRESARKLHKTRTAHTGVFARAFPFFFRLLGRCEVPNCEIRPHYGYDGEAPRFCAQHRAEGMHNLRSRRCQVRNFLRVYVPGKTARMCAEKGRREWNMELVCFFFRLRSCVYCCVIRKIGPTIWFSIHFQKVCTPHVGLTSAVSIEPVKSSQGSAEDTLTFPHRPRAKAV